MGGDPDLARAADMPLPPLCPVTQVPARRLVQWISPGFLTNLWRYSAGVEVGAALRRAGRLGLWESPCGLMFFDPPVVGDAAFYRAFYGATAAHEKLTGRRTVRQEFQLAADRIRPGDRVLDVGCGTGGFRSYVPESRYTGLDPHFGSDDEAGPVLAETLDRHAARCAGTYDAVCAFQVIEHVADPLGFARDAVACLRPGGTLVLGVPFWPSPNTTVPNFVLNAPPHHVTWWSARALVALSDRLGLESAEVREVGMSRHEALMYWMAKLTPIRCGTDRFFAPKYTWHAALAFSYGLARILAAIVPLPASTPANALLLTARKPG